MTSTIDGLVASRRLANAPERIKELRSQVEKKLWEVQTFADPRLSNDGLIERRQQLMTQARSELTPEVTSFESEVVADHETVAGWAATVRPVAADAAALMRQQFAWDKVRLLLDSGKSLIAAVATADVETLLAIREWGPTWLEARRLRPSGVSSPLSLESLPYDASGLLRAIDERLIAIEGGVVAQALAALRDADAVLAATAPIVAYLKAVIQGSAPNGSGLLASIQSHYAGAGARLSIEDLLAGEQAAG